MDTVKIESFTQEWWKNFLQINQNFTETCVIEDVMNDELVEELQLGILQVLKERYKKDDIYDGFRVYLDGEEQNDSFLENLCKTPPLEGEDITAYTKRMFEQKFGIIINAGEKHSDIIANNIIKFLHPLMELVGCPPLGVEITIFIGNYGWTPLGIHQDHKGENVIHFHLGPGKKTMYTWDEEKYNELTGEEHNNKNIEPLLEHANEYPFKKGDIYYMPWNKYHVGYSGELSVGITLWFNNAPKTKYVHRILNSFRYQFLKQEKEIIPSQMDYLNNHATFEDMLSSFKLDDNILNYSLKDFLKFVYGEFKMALMSNGGWQSVPLSLDVKDDYNIDDFEKLRGQKIINRAPFKIQYRKYKQSLWVYVRGAKFEMRYFEELVNVIDTLNKNEELLVDDLLDLLPEVFPQEAVLYFLSLTLNKRGIEVL
ncbi:hypothetical protein BKI52_26920 [marine bacterium AO1-C]|nr:hypothetical protein BKI52_26920 [marine bacterium AO1-C]